MLGTNICSAALFDLQSIDGLLKAAMEELEVNDDDSLISIEEIVQAVKYQCEVFVHGALHERLCRLV